MVRELDHGGILWSGGDVRSDVAELLESPLLEGSTTLGLRPFGLIGHQASGFVRLIFLDLNSRFLATLFPFILILPFFISFVVL